LYNKVEKISAKLLTQKAFDLHPVEFDNSGFVKAWNSSKKKLVLVGVNLDEKIDKEVLKLLSQDSSVIVMTEITSNISDINFLQISILYWLR